MHVFHRRQGQMDINLCYFYTDTIYGFRPLLADDNLKMVVVSSLQYLVHNNLVILFGYVIMPNHIHLLWNILQRNGKESPAGSFAKHTAHQFKKYLAARRNALDSYRSEKKDRQYQFWKRDPLAIPVSTQYILINKLDYIHNNPVREKWSLCNYPEEYRWSSAKFYLTGKDEFGMLRHFKE
jgi:putative transposase